MENTAMAVQDGPNLNQVAQFFDTERFQSMAKMAEAFAKSGAFGRDVPNGYVALAKIQAGLEMGLPPMEAMNSLYIVNGHIGPYGAAQSKMLRKKGWALKYEDKEDEKGNPVACTVTVSKDGEVHTYTAKASELTKSNAFKIAPKNKLRWHGLGQIIRFEIPEVTDAGMMYLAEELEDLEPAKMQVSNVVGADAEPQLSATDWMKKINESQDMQELNSIKSDLAKIFNDFTADEQGKLLLTLGKRTEEVTIITKENTGIPTQQVQPPKVQEVAAIAQPIPPAEVMPEPAKPASTVNVGNLTPDNIKKTIAGLTLPRELAGYADYLSDEFSVGNITQFVFDEARNLIVGKMQQIEAKNASTGTQENMFS